MGTIVFSPRVIDMKVVCEIKYRIPGCEATTNLLLLLKRDTECESSLSMIIPHLYR